MLYTHTTGEVNLLIENSYLKFRSLNSVYWDAEAIILPLALKFVSDHNIETRKYRIKGRGFLKSWSKIILG